MTDRNARPPEKVHRAFVQTAKKVSPAQRKRDDEAAEAEMHKAHQAQLKADAYRRLFGTEPPEAA